MKKGLRTTLIVIGILAGIIILDTTQAIVFNNSPIIKITKTYSSSQRKDIGILVETYIFDGITKITRFKWEAHTLPTKENGKSNNNKECCEGCLCGDSIELLKTTETAWTLTEINNKDEYVYTRSFINFHGTGKNKFAFFKYGENDHLLSETTGEFTINEKKEIILVPNNQNNRIICKLGEERNLIAVMHCNNDFGTFTLQKQGILELPDIIKDTISKTKTIIVKGKNEKTITEKKEINALLSVVNNSKVWTGATTLPSPLYELELFDDSNSIAKILYNPGHYFDIEINNKSYNLTDIDKNSLNAILEK